MKKIIIREEQEGIITGHIALNETPGFKEKCEEIARLLGASVNTTLNGEICLTNETMHAVLGIDPGDGSKFYGPSIMVKSVGFSFLTSDPAGYETAKASFDKLMEVVGNSELLAL
jgi:hypothetical protein